MAYSYSGFGPLRRPLDFSVSQDEGTYLPAGMVIHECCADYSTTTVCCHGETLTYYENQDLSPRFYTHTRETPFCLEDEHTDSGIHLHKPPLFDRNPLAQTYLEDRGVFYQVITVILQKNRQWGIYVYDPNCTLEGTSLRYDPIAQLNVRKSETECSVSLDILRDLPLQTHLACFSLPFTLGLLS